MAKKEKSPIEQLLESIQSDQVLLTEKETLLTQTKEEKKQIVDRLKDYRKDIPVLYKYATAEQKSLIESLGFDNRISESGLNPVAQIALDILTEKKKLTNEELYNAYLDTVPETLDALEYTKFNIRIRSLFSSQYLIKTRAGDGMPTRDDLISLNGSE